MGERNTVTLVLTTPEARALEHAASAGTVDETIDSIGFTPAEKAAFRRAMDKLSAALVKS